MRSITVDTQNKTYDSRNSCNAIIEKTTNKLIAGCKGTIIPATVTAIGEYAFAWHQEISAITLPNSIISIEKNAFYNCTALKTIYSQIEAPFAIDESVFQTWDSSAKKRMFSTATLYVPKGCVSEYKQTDGWKNFNSIIELSGVQQKLILTVTPNGGNVDAGTKVYLSVTASGSSVSGSNIYYTLNGNTPSTSSTRYASSGITISYSCTLKAIAYKDGYADSDVLTAYYTVNDNEPKTATCAEVLAGTDGKVYRVTGTVGAITNTIYGNWYLSDNTGEIYIYGTRDKEGNNGQNNSIEAWGIREGATITVEGPRNTYKDIIELKDVTVVSVEAGPSYNTDRTVRTSADGYATFYDSQSAYMLPSGLSASVVSSASNRKLVYNRLTGNVIPKGTPVMLTASMKRAGNYTLTTTTSNSSYTGTNLLHGSDEATTTTSTGNDYYYKLTYGQSGTSLGNVFGWYWGAQDGGAFQIEGHRAWLAVPKSAATRGYSASGETLDIMDVEHSSLDIDGYYDLQGRRHGTPSAKGVYIKKGKKIVIK